MQKEFEKRADPNDKGAQALLEEMRQHIKKVYRPSDLTHVIIAQLSPGDDSAGCSCLLQLEDMRKNEDPRLSFSTPEFKEAQRIFTDSFKVCHPSAAQAQHISQRRSLPSQPMCAHLASRVS